MAAGPQHPPPAALPTPTQAECLRGGAELGWLCGPQGPDRSAERMSHFFPCTVTPPGGGTAWDLPQETREPVPVLGQGPCSLILDPATSDDTPVLLLLEPAGQRLNPGSATISY